MSEEATVEIEDIQKSLKAALDQIAKGHGSKGTATLQVENMSTQGGATQIHHTPSNSDPGSWAGSVERDVPENGATDDISENNVNYQGNGQMVKSILDKLAKGQPLTATEFALIKGAMPFGKEDDKEEEDDCKKGDYEEDMDKAKYSEDDMDKSVTSQVSNDESLKKGFEVTDFLSGWSNSVTKSLDAQNRALFKSITKYIDTRFEQLRTEQDNVTKSLAVAVGAAGDAALLSAQRVAEFEAGPAHAPKSITGLRALEKGGFGTASSAEEIISKAMNGDRGARTRINGVLAGMVERKECSPKAAIKYDCTGEISNELLQKVSAQL